MASLAQSPNGAPQARRPSPRLIAFYLPQFHPVPENDVFWGKGHTEWTYVVQAKPRFPGHYQPRIPADLGFYDLRLPEVRQAQVDLAREHGIYGFCYFHYWFKGRRVLERPFDEVLESGHPDFPFCLCWANHDWNWSRNDKEGRARLIAQEYSEDDDREHIRWLLDVFQDQRYIKINGRPLLLIYRPFDMPEPLRTFTMWREEAQKRGVAEPYICKVDSRGNVEPPGAFGCDAAVEFWPHNLETLLVERINRPEKAYVTNRIYEYRDLVARHLERPESTFGRFPCVIPDRDNTPRAEYAGENVGARIIRGSTPELYGHWLEAVIRKVSSDLPEEQLVFINAWNEWSEGSYLEPDVKHGRAYLEATRRALIASGAEVDSITATSSSKAIEVAPIPSSAEKLYRDLLDKYALLQQQVVELLSGEEQSPLLREAEHRIMELERANKELEQANRQLVHGMQRLDQEVSALLGSRRWKLGEALGEAARRALLRPRVPTVQDSLVQTIAEFRASIRLHADQGPRAARARTRRP